MPSSASTLEPPVITGIAASERRYARTCVKGIIPKFNNVISTDYAIVKKNDKVELRQFSGYPVVFLESIDTPVLSNNERVDKIFSKADIVREGVFEYNAKRGVMRGAFTETAIQIVNFSENRLKCEMDLVTLAGNKLKGDAIPREMAAVLSVDFKFDRHDTGACLVASLSLLLGVDLREGDVEWSYFSPGADAKRTMLPISADVLQVLKKNAR